MVFFPGKESDFWNRLIYRYIQITFNGLTFSLELDFALPALAMIFMGLVGTSVLVELGLMQKFSRLMKLIFATTIVLVLQEGGVFEIFSMLRHAKFFKITPESIVPLTSLL